MILFKFWAIYLISSAKNSQIIFDFKTSPTNILVTITYLSIMKLTFQRKTLYEEVWSIPKKKLTKKFGITYYHLKKICNELNIPTPPLGYWKKLKHNKKVKRTPLPKEGPDSYTLKKRDLISSDIHGLLPEKMKPITVKKHLRSPHPIVRATHNQLKEREVDRYKRLEPIKRRIFGCFCIPKKSETGSSNNGCYHS